MKEHTWGPTTHLLAKQHFKNISNVRVSIHIHEMDAPTTREPSAREPTPPSGKEWVRMNPIQLIVVFLLARIVAQYLIRLVDFLHPHFCLLLFRRIGIHHFVRMIFHRE